MPTYQYACTACDERLEAVQSFTDAALTECPVCSGRLRKVFSAVGVVFKGSGFYKTDSRAGAKATADAGSSDNSSGDKGSSDKGSSDKGSSDKPAADKGSGGKAAPTKVPAASGSSSSSSTPAAKSA